MLSGDRARETILSHARWRLGSGPRLESEMMASGVGRVNQALACVALSMIFDSELVA